MVFFHFWRLPLFQPSWMFQILTFIEVSILAKMQIATFVEVATFQSSIFGMMNPLSSEIFTPPPKKSSSYFNTISGLIYTYHQWANWHIPSLGLNNSSRDQWAETNNTNKEKSQFWDFLPAFSDCKWNQKRPVIVLQNNCSRRCE